MAMYWQATTQPATGEQGITVPDVARNGSTPHATAAPRPVFILGTPYSGNSIVSWALSQHPNFSHVLETGWLVNLATELHRVYQGAVAEPATSQLVALSISASEFVSRFGEAADRVLLPRSPSAPQTPQRWVDCTPAHAFQVPVLLELFPEAKFIHVLYDVSSVVRSLMSRSKVEIARGLTPDRGEYDLESAQALWLSTTRAALEAELAYGSDRVHRMHYSRLVADPRGTMQRCLEFLGEPFDEACLRPLKGLTLPGQAGEDGDAHAPSIGVSEEAILLSDLLAHSDGVRYPGDPVRLEALQKRVEESRQKHAVVAPGGLDGSLNARVKDMMRRVLPEKARALVITKGDDDLLALDGIAAGHFPQNPDGSYKGYYPADSSEAISDLQRMRDKGDEYLVIPSAYYWWLDYYAEWREYLMSQYRVVAFQEDVALIVALKQPAGEEPLKLAVLTSG